MKKIWVFIFGIITGIVLTILFAVIATNSSNEGRRGLNIFEQPGECLIKQSSLEVFQVLEPNVALTMINGEIGSAVYLLVNNEGKTYYDDQVIKLPSGKCFKQIGTYQYPTKDDRLKTVPVVQIM